MAALIHARGLLDAEGPTHDATEAPAAEVPEGVANAAERARDALKKTRGGRA